MHTVNPTINRAPLTLAWTLDVCTPSVEAGCSATVHFHWGDDSWRSVAAPEVPTLAETIPGFQCVNWYAMLAPAGTPPAILARLNAEIVKMIADPPFAQRLIDLGSEPQSSSPAERLHAQGVRALGPGDQGAGLKIER